MLIIGTRLFTWGAQPTANPIRCGTCGTVGTFIHKTAMRFFTIFFIIPVIPISGKMKLIECPKCKSRYEWNEPVAASSASA